jgi:hypothetical protein
MGHYHAVDRSTVRALVEKSPRVAPEDDWQVHYAFFARAGFTEAACTEAEAVGVRLVDLTTLDADLRDALSQSANRSRGQ